MKPPVYCGRQGRLGGEAQPVMTIAGPVGLALLPTANVGVLGTPVALAPGAALGSQYRRRSA